MKKIILFLFLFLILRGGSFAKDYGLKIHFIDIGEGDSILVQTQKESTLIDTGNLLSGHKLVRYLKEHNVASLNNLIITHHDLDHIMGVFFIMPEFKIKNIYDNGFKLEASGNKILEYYEKVFRSKENYRILKSGDTLKLGDVILEVIWPQNIPISGSFNHNSLVIILKYKDFRCLLTADIDSPAEEELLKKNLDFRTDVLKVAHHGAKDATSYDFIRKTNPAIAVISVDKDNRQGYPAQNILDLLSERNIKTYRTDISGSLIIAVNSRDDYVIYAERPQ